MDPRLIDVTELRNVPAGDTFRFVGARDRGHLYVSRGNGWFNTIESYSGGPWCAPERIVLVIATETAQ